MATEAAQTDRATFIFIAVAALYDSKPVFQKVPGLEEELDPLAPALPEVVIYVDLGGHTVAAKLIEAVDLVTITPDSLGKAFRRP